MLDRSTTRFQDLEFATQAPSSARFKIDTTRLQQQDKIKTVVDAILEGGKAGEPAQAIKLTFFDECSAIASKRWLIKGVAAIGETSSWIAPPGKGKSALQTDISVNIAAGIDWRGYRSKGPHGVVYFAFERGDLVKRRLTAYARQRNLKALPIAVASQIIDLMHPGCVEVILETIRAAEQRFGIRVGYIVIDTFAKGIAAGGGDEDKARDQNKCLTNLRRLHECAELHVAIVGHTGKDETRGCAAPTRTPPTWTCKSRSAVTRSSSRG
jgi:RecA-family ATPase